MRESAIKIRSKLKKADNLLQNPRKNDLWCALKTKDYFSGFGAV